MHLIRTILRIAMLAAGGLLIVQSLALWDSTGRAMFTRYVNEERAAAEAQAAQSDVASLFDDAGLNEGFESIELPPNHFALGLLPATYPWRVWDRDLFSVMTVAGPGALLIVFALLPWRFGRRGATISQTPLVGNESDERT